MWGNPGTQSFTNDTRNQATGFVAEHAQYDANGNLIGRTNAWDYVTFSYTYDDENRLTFMEYDDNGTPYYQFSQLAYDGLGRLRSATEYFWDEGLQDWVVSDVKAYIYDNWRVIQERDENNTPLASYTRGSDLSGSLEGAGGIGGLLARSHGYSSGNWSTNSYYFADGNGNVTYMTDTSQSMVASYRYDPFGNEITASGSLAFDNSYRFSSKEMIGKNLETWGCLYYYGYRFYEPFLQRWINRDPLEEPGFRRASGVKSALRVPEANLFIIVANNPIILLDPLGLKDWGPLGGTCCNNSKGTEWGLVGGGKWKKLPPGACTGFWEDCDGMTCGGGFYAVYNGYEAHCRTPGKDSSTCARRRWTPTAQGPDAEPPVWDPSIGRGRGSMEGNTPPDYKYEKE